MDSIRAPHNSYIHSIFQMKMVNPITVILLFFFAARVNAVPEQPPSGADPIVNSFLAQFDKKISSGNLTEIASLFADEFIIDICGPKTNKEVFVSTILSYLNDGQQLYLIPIKSEMIDEVTVEFDAKYGFVRSKAEVEYHGLNAKWTLLLVKMQFLSAKTSCGYEPTLTTRKPVFTEGPLVTEAPPRTESPSEPFTPKMTVFNEITAHQSDSADAIMWGQLIALMEARKTNDQAMLTRLTDRHTDLEKYYFENPNKDIMAIPHLLSEFMKSSTGLRYFLSYVHFDEYINHNRKTVVMLIYMVEIEATSPTGWQIRQSKFCHDPKNCPPHPL
uniref:SnoaL-like domain-containing protein n=2 Tax=Caenorhabditis tropicalis TaxID=1561998 RepID=A0A1I7URK1_9PELO